MNNITFEDNHINGVEIPGSTWHTDTWDNTDVVYYVTGDVTVPTLHTLTVVAGMKIKFVGSASLFGPLNYSMRVWLNPDRMTSFNLAPTDVVNAIQAQNVQAAVGRIGAEPISNDQQVQLNLTTQGRLTTVPEFESIVRLVRSQLDVSVRRILQEGKS